LEFSCFGLSFEALDKSQVLPRDAIALLQLGGTFQAQQEQGLIPNATALLFGLRGKPCVRFVVGVDDDLLHGWGYTGISNGCCHTRQTFFHTDSQFFIDYLNCAGVAPPYAAMPNQRKQGKKKIGAWGDDSEKEQIDAMLKKHGVKGKRHNP
jgi:hypothetical protein